MCLLVSTVVSVFVRGDVARRLHTLGFPSAPSLRESLRQLSAPHLRTHHYPIRCAPRVRIPSHLLSSCPSKLIRVTASVGVSSARVTLPSGTFAQQPVSSRFAVPGHFGPPRALTRLSRSQPEQLLNHEPAQLGTTISEYHELTSPARMSPSPDHGGYYSKNHPLHTRRYHVPSQQPDHGY